MTKNIIGFDAKRIVRNGTGLGSYGRTLVNDLAQRQDLVLRLYAPDKGRDDLRSQIVERPNVSFCYPHFSSSIHLPSSWWRMKGVVTDLQRDGVQLYHGLSGELPIGIRKSGIRSVVTIHDLIFLRHPEFYNWVDTKIYAWKFRQTLREADHILLPLASVPSVTSCTMAILTNRRFLSSIKVSHPVLVSKSVKSNVRRCVVPISYPSVTSSMWGQ